MMLVGANVLKSCVSSDEGRGLSLPPLRVDVVAGGKGVESAEVTREGDGVMVSKTSKLTLLVSSRTSST